MYTFMIDGIDFPPGEVARALIYRKPLMMQERHGY
jgi:hypothetical protein